MLIIAKKKDYYDGVVGTVGVDKTIVYDRIPIEYERDSFPKFFHGRTGIGKKHTSTPFHMLDYHSVKKEYRELFDEHAFFIIGFCGKLYVGWKLYCADAKYPHEVKTTITYNLDDIKTFLEPRGFNNNLEDSINYVQNFNALQLFREFNAPVFVYDSDYNRLHFDFRVYNNHKSKFIINPLLKDYEFGKLFGAVQAFQEISMFMGGVLGRGEKEITEVADKYKITQHGFDYKYSFRKEPEVKNKT